MASDRRNLFWTLAHIGLGFLCTLTPFALIIWFYFLLVSNFKKAYGLLGKKKPALFLLLFAYLISFELLDRMAKTSPFLPYELGKYFLVLIGFLGLLKLGVRSNRGLIMAVLITPGVLYDLSNQRVYYDIINYYLGPLAVGLGIAFSDKLQIGDTQLKQILKVIWLASLSSLIFTIIKTPDFEDITFELGANFDTTAGHSSNQVSTVLGLGMFLSFCSVYKRWNYAGNRMLDIAVLGAFTFQGLLSFSRGGMTVGALGILTLLIVPEIKTRVGQQKSKAFIFGIISLFVLYGVFEIANNITGGNLLLRYQGETAGTLSGTKKVTADHFVTGRLGIMEQDINLWLDHFFTGVGVGGSRFLRDLNRVGVAPHVEFSRLLADHGILGLIYAVMFFVIVPFNAWKKNKGNPHRVLIFTLILISILTTFHAAMRTFLTPLFIIIGSLRLSSTQAQRLKTT